MSKTRGGVYITVLFALFSCVSSTIATEKTVLYKKGAHIFTQKNANELIEFAEFIGRSSFKAKDRKALQAWSIQDYKAAAKKGDVFYKDLNKNLMPKIRAMKNSNKRNNYRADLYLGYVNLFRKHPEYKKSPNNLLAVIDRYNPPVQEAMVLQQINFNNFQQRLKLNQMVFNQTMRLQQQSADMVNKSIRDLGNRYSITVSGGTILYETEDRIFAKDSKGRKFDVPR